MTVKSFRTIMLLPLILEEGAVLKSELWVEQDNLLDYLGAADLNSYAEFNYFHDFVQDFLYQSESPIKLYKRSDVLELQCDAHISLLVHRLALYIFPNNVAFLVVEVGCDAESHFTLKQVQNINETLRRVFPPHLYGKTVYNNLAFVTDKLQKIGGEKSNQAFLEEFKTTKQVDYLPAWQQLLGSALNLKKCRHVSDDRMPLMTHIVLNAGQYHYISEGDWQRLAFIDRAGQDKTPYAASFLQKLNDTHFYDRFHFKMGDSSDAPSRILVSGYSFSIVADNTTFNESNFRRHYFQIFLLAHFEQLSLLAFSSRITKAVKEKNTNFRGNMNKIQSDFLEFTHKFRFTGITNQLQGIELNALVRKQMGLDALYNDVKEEIASSNSYLNNEATIGLTYFAAFGVIASVSIALASMGLMFGDTALKAIFKIDDKALIIGRVAVFIGCFAIVTGFAGFFAAHSENILLRHLKKKLLCYAGFFMILLVVLYLCQILSCRYLSCW